jgi:hypothetical protein
MEGLVQILTSFQAPWLLAGLVAIPALWWLLRHQPPRARHVDFPATWIIARIQEREETPTTTPWWLLALRALLLACVIFGLARPLLNERPSAAGDGPLLLVMDNDWTTAAHWQARMDTAQGLIDRAEQRGVGVALVIAEAPVGQAMPRLNPGFLTAEQARERLSILEPRPWTARRGDLLQALRDAKLPHGADVHWLWNGIGGPQTQEIAGLLATGNHLMAHAPTPADTPFFISALEERGDALNASLSRLDPMGAAEVTLRFSDAEGHVIARQTARFADGAARTAVQLRLPADTMGHLARAEIVGQGSAAATYAFGDDWRRRRVGLVTLREDTDALPLTSPLYYINRALAPVTQVQTGALNELMTGMDAIILTDQSLGPDAIMKLTEWIKTGGLVLRFAGDALAARPDQLTPMNLRPGGREMGAAMTWDKPVPLGDFDDKSPFAGLSIPKDVTVARQVLADPNSLDGAEIWARLEDGTPLVTARRMGDGLLVMIHVGADPAYSTLPYSGLFVEMLERIVKLSGSRHAPPAQTQAGMTAHMVMDGFGRMQQPPAGLPGIPAGNWDVAVPSPLTPPGLYEGAQGSRALNLAGRADIAGGPVGLAWPRGVNVETIGEGVGLDLMPWLIAAALALFGLDIAVSFARRLLPRRAIAAASLVAFALLSVLPRESEAQTTDKRQLSPEEWAVAAAGETHLAYVQTRDAGSDRLTESGLQTLSNMLSLRTSVEPAQPMAVDLERDDIAFFPVLYWAVSAPYPHLSAAAIEKLQRYMRTGGLLVVDTGDGTPLRLAPGIGQPSDAAPATLAAFVAQFATQPLSPVASDHVLTKSFYLLQDFPGRWAGQTVYVSARSNGDAVSPIIVTSNGWAAGWALGADNKPMVPIIPGGPMQQEYAWRTGINMVMYALTGTYKSDQVHVPALLERLGQ